MNDKQLYEQNSIDSKITELLVKQNIDNEERRNFRLEIISRLKVIENNTSDHSGRLDTLEREQKEIKEKTDEMYTAFDTSKKSIFTLKNILIGLSFVLALIASIRQVF